MSAPATSRIALTQDRIASPFLWTVQAPQSAMPQPNFVPVRFNSSRRYHSNGISGSPLNERSTPLTLSWIIFSSPFNRESPKSEYRNPKQTSKFEIQKSESRNDRLEFLCFLNIWICFEFRISSFQFI